MSYGWPKTEESARAAAKAMEEQLAGADLLIEFGNYLRDRYDHLEHEWIAESAVCDRDEQLTCLVCGATRTQRREDGS